MRKIMLACAMLFGAMAVAGAQTGSCNTGGTPQCTDKQTISTSTGSITIQSNGGLFPSFEYLFVGSPSSSTMTVEGCGVGGTCETLDIYTGNANVIRSPALTKPYGYFMVFASWSGGTNVSVGINTKLTTAAGTPSPSSVAGTALNSSTQSALTTPAVVKTSGGNVFGMYALNGAASTCWVQLSNSASSPTLGTGVVFSIPLPASTTQPLYLTPSMLALGNFSTGISVGIATTATGSTPCGSGGNLVVFYE